MGWLGLDWGNVPGWFSAGSFMTAGYVIVRDRQHKKRQQVDGIGMWGDFELYQDEDSVQFGFITPRIHIKNASSLPAYLEEASYEVTYTWSIEANAGYFYFPFDTIVGNFSGKIGDVIAPPGVEIVICGVDKRAIERPLAPGCDAGVTSRAPGSRLTIKEFVVVDNAHRRWRVLPRTGSRNAVSRQTRTRRFPPRLRRRFAHPGEAATRQRS